MQRGVRVFSSAPSVWSVWGHVRTWGLVSDAKFVHTRQKTQPAHTRLPNPGAQRERPQTLARRRQARRRFLQEPARMNMVVASEGKPPPRQCVCTHVMCVEGPFKKKSVEGPGQKAMAPQRECCACVPPELRWCRGVCGGRTQTIFFTVRTFTAGAPSREGLGRRSGSREGGALAWGEDRALWAAAAPARVSYRSKC